VPCGIPLADAIKLHEAATQSAVPDVIKPHAISAVTLAATQSRDEAAELLRYLQATTPKQWANNGTASAASIRLEAIGAAARLLAYFATN
jgi:hypothetical protein